MAPSPLDVLFPLRCAGCGRGPWPFCSTCNDDLVPLSPPWCARCGRPDEASVAACRDCPPAEISMARAPFLFTGAVRTALHRLKFSGWRAVADALGAAMVTVNEFEAEAVTWVPLSGRRRSQRGYDQSRALARSVGRRLDLPVVRLVDRIRDTPAQARLSRRLRMQAVQGAFRAHGGPIATRVLLVDDVLTTGATAAACAWALRSAGTSRVGLLTVARSLSGPLPARCYTRAGSRLGLWLPGERPR